MDRQKRGREEGKVMLLDCVRWISLLGTAAALSAWVAHVMELIEKT
jgi:hypothetical protein